jgi:hypothetical protein
MCLGPRGLSSLRGTGCRNCRARWLLGRTPRPAEMDQRARTGWLVYPLWTALPLVTAGDISTTAEIVAWILSAAIGVP